MVDEIDGVGAVGITGMVTTCTHGRCAAAPVAMAAHMPHMIDKDIMADLVDMFPEEWAATSSHRLRSPEDMQYAFAYFWYLIGLQKEFDLSKGNIRNSKHAPLHDAGVEVARV